MVNLFQDGTLHQQSTIKDIQIFPNPTNAYITIVQKQLQEFFYELYTIEGKKLSAGVSKAQFQTNINLQEYPQGIYVLKISTKQNSKIFSIIKQN